MVCWWEVVNAGCECHGPCDHLSAVPEAMVLNQPFTQKRSVAVGVGNRPR